MSNIYIYIYTTGASGGGPLKNPMFISCPRAEKCHIYIYIFFFSFKLDKILDQTYSVLKTTFRLYLNLFQVNYIEGIIG